MPGPAQSWTSSSRRLKWSSPARQWRASEPARAPSRQPRPLQKPRRTKLVVLVKKLNCRKPRPFCRISRARMQRNQLVMRESPLRNGNRSRLSNILAPAVAHFSTVPWGADLVISVSRSIAVSSVVRTTLGMATTEPARAGRQRLALHEWWSVCSAVWPDCCWHCHLHSQLVGTAVWAPGLFDTQGTLFPGTFCGQSRDHWSSSSAGGADFASRGYRAVTARDLAAGHHRCCFLDPAHCRAREAPGVLFALWYTMQHLHCCSQTWWRTSTVAISGCSHGFAKFARLWSVPCFSW